MKLQQALPVQPAALELIPAADVFVPRRGRRARSACSAICTAETSLRRWFPNSSLRPTSSSRHAHTRLHGQARLGVR